MTTAAPEELSRLDAAQIAVALDLTGVVKRFGAVVAVDHVYLRVERGEIVTLLGPSGSGKTTILRMIAGFELPSGGQIRLDGKDVSRASPAERDIGMVFQHYALFPHMTVADNVGYGLKLRGWSKDRRRARVAETLALVRLEGYERRRPHQLSGGQQQRVALARALAFGPKILLMDEPLGALDRTLRMEMKEEIRRIHRESGATMIYVTHDQEEALALSDRIAILRNGRILAYDTARSLFENPPSAFVASFFADCNLLPVSNLEGEPTFLAARPSCLRLQHPGGDAISVEGRLDEVLFLGETTQLISTRVADGGRVVARVPSSAAASLSPNDPITLYASRDDLIVVADDISTAGMAR